MTAHHVATIKVYSTDRDALLQEVENIQAFVAERDEDSDVFTATTVHDDTVDLEEEADPDEQDVTRDLIRISIPQTPEEAVTCPHGNKVWFGHECGLCDDTLSPGDMPGRPSTDRACRKCGVHLRKVEDHDGTPEAFIGGGEWESVEDGTTECQETIGDHEP